MKSHFTGFAVAALLVTGSILPGYAEEHDNTGRYTDRTAAKRAASVNRAEKSGASDRSGDHRQDHRARRQGRIGRATSPSALCASLPSLSYGLLGTVSGLLAACLPEQDLLESDSLVVSFLTLAGIATRITRRDSDSSAAHPRAQRRHSSPTAFAFLKHNFFGVVNLIINARTRRDPTNKRACHNCGVRISGTNAIRTRSRRIQHQLESNLRKLRFENNYFELFSPSRSLTDGPLKVDACDKITTRCTGAIRYDQSDLIVR